MQLTETEAPSSTKRQFPWAQYLALEDWVAASPEVRAPAEKAAETLAPIDTAV